MGHLKDEAMANVSEDVQQHQLTDSEANYLRLLNLALQYHTLSGKIMSGYLYQVCVNRLGYQSGVNLQFEFDFDSPTNTLTVKLLPESALQQPPAPSDDATPTGPAPTA